MEQEMKQLGKKQDTGEDMKKLEMKQLELKTKSGGGREKKKDSEISVTDMVYRFAERLLLGITLAPISHHLSLCQANDHKEIPILYPDFLNLFQLYPETSPQTRLCCHARF